jgi:hypothetical protein
LVTSITESFGLTFHDRNEQQRYITNNASLGVSYYIDRGLMLNWENRLPWQQEQMRFRSSCAERVALKAAHGHR